MVGAASSSRDDFSINAFALLPPPAISDSGASCEHSAASLGSKDPREDEEQADEVATPSGENPMMLLKLNLAHTELRDTIELLYQSIQSLESENEELRRANACSIESEKRVKAQMKTAEEKAREKLRTRDHETTRLSHNIRELGREKERLQAEVAELQVKLSERDKVIDALQNRIHELEEQQTRANEVARQEAEMRQLMELWSSKERSVAENTNHVREATSAVQGLSEQLQKQLKEVQTALMSTEEEHETFRAYINEHKCNTRPSSHTPVAKLHELQRKVRKGEQASLEKTAEIHVLRTKCREHEKSIRLLTAHLERERAKHDANKSLLVKYENSAADGTQTIDELQESLLKLCEQLAHERKEFEAQLKKLLQTSTSEKASLEQKILDLGNQLRSLSQDLEDTKHIASSKPCEYCISRAITDNERQSNRVSESADAASVVVSPAPTPRYRAHKPLVHHQIDTNATQYTSKVHNEIEDVIEDSDSDIVTTTTTSKKPVRQSATPTPSRAAGKLPNSCRLCNEEPFGFMVRCQKCKDAFHAGCAKNSISGAKKRLGHIFKCNNCAPQRPAKVQRNGADRDVTEAVGEKVSQRKDQAVPLTVAPSRVVVVARPPPSDAD